jgi:hypothetical protein
MRKLRRKKLKICVIFGTPHRGEGSVVGVVHGNVGRGECLTFSGGNGPYWFS